MSAQKSVIHCVAFYIFLPVARRLKRVSLYKAVHPFSPIHGSTIKLGITTLRNAASAMCTPFEDENKYWLD